jgi:hypothetical protein
MTKQVQLRRGTTSQHSVFTGALAEVTVDTDLKVAVVHDGTTLGGNYLVGVGAAQTITNKLALGIRTDNPEKPLHVVGDSLVEGDVRITGILSVGQSTISFNGSSNTINVGSGVTISGSTGIVNATRLFATEVIDAPTIVVNKLDITGFAVTTFVLNTNIVGTVSSGSTVIPVSSIFGVNVGDKLYVSEYFSGSPIVGLGVTTSTSFTNLPLIVTSTPVSVSAGSSIIPVFDDNGVSIGNSISLTSGIYQLDNVEIVGLTTVPGPLVDQVVLTTNITKETLITDTVIAVGNTSGVAIGQSFSADGGSSYISIVGVGTTTIPDYNFIIAIPTLTSEVGIGSTVIFISSVENISIGNSILITGIGTAGITTFLDNVPIVGVNTDSVVVSVGAGESIPLLSSVSISTIRTDSSSIILSSAINQVLVVGDSISVFEKVNVVYDAVIIGSGSTIPVEIPSATSVSISTYTDQVPAVLIGIGSVSELEITDSPEASIRRETENNTTLNSKHLVTENLNVTGISSINNAIINGLTFPVSDGLKGQVLQTDGDGNIGFGTGGGGSGSQVLVRVSQATGDDANDGRTLPVKTIKRAAQIASFLGYFFNTGATILVESGDYIEDNPIILYDNVNIIADSLRNVVMRPANAGIDFFKVRNGNYITGLTFTDYVDPLTKVPQHTFDYAISFDEPFNNTLNRTGYACTGTLQVTNAIYDQVSGVTTITTSTPHELYPTNTVRLTGLGWTCGYDETGIASIRYNNVVGISTLTLRSAPNRDLNGGTYRIGEKLFLYNFPFACSQEHAGVTTTIFPYNGLDDQGYGAIYPIIGVNTAAKTITIQGGISTIPHIYVGWQKLGISTFAYTNTTGVSTATTREDHGYQVNDKITLTGLAFTCPGGSGITTTLFPDGTINEYNVDGYTFTITGVTTNSFTFNAGISTIVHTYTGFAEVGISTFIYTNSTGVATCVVTANHGLVAGDYVTLTGLAFTCPGGSGITTTIFPDGTSPYGYTFRVSNVDNATTFTINVGVSTISHDYVSGGTAKKVPTAEKVPTIQKIQFYPDQHQSGVIDFGIISAESPNVFTIRGEKKPTIPHYYVAGIGGTAVLSKPQIFKSPYIQNCTILSSLGGNGILVDGDKVISPNVPPVQLLAENPPAGDTPEFGKSMVAATFTMISFDGIGWRTINDGYAQVVSCFQIFCRYGSLSQSGGYLSITNSATNFGSIALRATGFSPNPFSFDKGRIAATGTSGGLQTLKVIGVGRTDQDLYVLRFLDNSNVDRTSLFKPIVIESTFNPAVGVNTNTDIITINGHPFIDGDSIVYLGNEKAEPPVVIQGLVNGNTYYVQYISANTIKLYEDDSFRRATDLRSAPSGINTFQKNNQEFIVNEIIDSHNFYQKLTLAGVGSTAIFNSGQEITQSVSGGSAVGFALTFRKNTRELIVSVESVGGSRYFFSETGGNIVDHGVNPIAVGVTIAAGITTLRTIEFKVDSTTPGNVIQGIGTLPVNYKCNLHRPSIVNSSSHTWEYSGSGTDYNALPQNGGKTDPTSEQVSELGGRVYASGTNELGDFKIGSQITAFNRSGNIVFNNKVSIGELDSIRLSLSGGVAVEEFSTDTNLGEGELGGPLNKRVSTQLAVRSFLSNRLGTFIDKTVSQNAIPNAVVQLNASGQINADLIPPKVVNFTKTNVGSGRTVLVNQIPAINILQGDTVVEPENSYVLVNDVVSQYLILDDDTRDYAFDNGDFVTSALAAAAVGVVTTPPQGIGIGTTIQSYVGYGQTGLVKGVLLGGIVSNPGANYSVAGIYSGVPLINTTGIGTSALADITIGVAGTVTNVKIHAGGRYYVSGDVLTVADANVGGRSGGNPFSLTVNDIETRLYIDLTNFQKFAGSPALADYIADGNAIGISTTLDLDVSYNINPTTIDTGGDVDFPNDRVVIGIGHTFQDGDPVKYTTNGGTNITGLIENTTYYAKRVGVSSIELHSTYALVSRQDLSGSGIGTHTFIRSGVSTAKDTIVFTNHGFQTGDPVRVTGNTPLGVTTSAFYYLGSLTQNTFTLHATQSDATSSASGVTFNPVSIAQTGTGTITFTKQNVRYSLTVNTSSSEIDNWSLLAQADIDAANIISGIISPSRLGSGSANSDTVLYGNSEYARVVRSVGFAATTPIGIVASSSQFGTGFSTHFGDLTITLNRVQSTLDLYSTTGVAKFKSSTFQIDSDGAVSIKNSATGDVDASTLGGQTGPFYLNSANHTGTIPIARGGTGQTGVPADGAILIGNGSAFNLVTTPVFKNNVRIEGSLNVTGISTIPTIQGNTNITGVATAAGPITASTSPFYRNATTIASNYTISAALNEMSAGPITINNGVTVTVNGDWSIV